MNDFGIFTWNSNQPGQFLIVHWKDDLPNLLIVGFWFLILAIYLHWKDRKLRVGRTIANSKQTNCLITDSKRGLPRR